MVQEQGKLLQTIEEKIYKRVVTKAKSEIYGGRRLKNKVIFC